jgi:hypothetical protein
MLRCLGAVVVGFGGEEEQQSCCVDFELAVPPVGQGTTCVCSAVAWSGFVDRGVEGMEGEVDEEEDEAAMVVCEMCKRRSVTVGLSCLQGVACTSCECAFPVRGT